MPPPKQTMLAQYKEGDVVWVKNPHGWCMSKFVTGCITRITSPQSVVVNNIPWHVGDVHPWISSLLPVDNGSDTTSKSKEEVGLTFFNLLHPAH